MESNLKTFIGLLSEALTTQGKTLVAAESCTGGLLASSLTDIAGSSRWFEGAFVTYRRAAKQAFLGVDAKTLERWGEVSEPTAKAMAEGALKGSSADLSVAITGIAGPGGGEVTTPTGTVWIAWACRADELVHTARFRFSGDRRAVRKLAAVKAVWGLLRLLDDSEQTSTAASTARAKKAPSPESGERSLRRVNTQIADLQSKKTA